jgi:alkylation response protein AidB-like acyl-CoA dehydrogenase
VPKTSETPSRVAELVAAVAELGPKFRERAEAYDREAAFPYGNWDDLADIGFLGLCIPERHGGIGADFFEYSRVAEELGRHCGSTALTFNMHTATCLVTGPIADSLGLSDDDMAVIEPRRAAMYQDILDNGTIHSQPFSEGLSGRATTGIATTADPVDGGYRINGRKIFASLAESAGIHDVVCLVPGDDRVRLMGVPADADGLTITGDWDPLGMRGTVSKTLLFENVFVPAENEWITPGVFDQLARRYPYFYMTLSFAYLGLSQGILDFTGAYLRGEIDGSDRSAHPQKQAVWADMNLRYEQAKAICHQTVADAEVDPERDDVKRAWAAMVTVMEAAPDIASSAIRACGGRSIMRPMPLERLYRDARCGATMLPWSVEVCLDRLGRYGIEGAKNENFA